MTDVGFVIAGYGVILGGAAMYAVTLLLRLRAAREASLRIRRDAEAARPPDRTA
jgi:uncharacterized membrane protein